MTANCGARVARTATRIRQIGPVWGTIFGLATEKLALSDKDNISMNSALFLHYSFMKIVSRRIIYSSVIIMAFRP